jgi:hypothetical protein
MGCFLDWAQRRFGYEMTAILATPESGYAELAIQATAMLLCNSDVSGRAGWLRAPLAGARTRCTAASARSFRGRLPSP